MDFHINFANWYYVVVMWSCSTILWDCSTILQYTAVLFWCEVSNIKFIALLVNIFIYHYNSHTCKYQIHFSLLIIHLAILVGRLIPYEGVGMCLVCNHHETFHVEHIIIANCMMPCAWGVIVCLVLLMQANAQFYTVCQSLYKHSCV